MTDLTDLLAGWLGPAPTVPAAKADLLVAWIETPLGAMLCVSDRDHLYLLEFAERLALAAETRRLSAAHGRIAPGRTAITDRVEAQLSAYFAEENPGFDLPLAPTGTDFQRRVWAELGRIPIGATASYSELARRIGRPRAIRAVARANGANPIALVIPCHRAIAADGALTGYGGGLWRKAALLEHEGAIPRSTADLPPGLRETTKKA